MNGSVYTESLADESIEDLGHNVDRHGLRHDIEVNENFEILDGERRWRHQMKGDPDAEIEVVVVAGKTSVEDIEEYIHDADAGNRNKSIGERIASFHLGLRVLGRRHGRSQGRPAEKGSRAENLFWSASKIRDEAARRAELGSYSTAMKAEKVMVDGNDDLKEALCSGEVSITAAYEQLLASKREADEEATSSGGPHSDPSPSDEDSDDGCEGPESSNVAPNPFALLHQKHEEADGEDENTDAASTPTASDDEEDDVGDLAEGDDELEDDEDDAAEPDEVLAESDDDTDEDDAEEPDIWETLDAMAGPMLDALEVASRTSRKRAFNWAVKFTKRCGALVKRKRAA